MTSWIRHHPYTLLGAFLVAAVVAVNVVWPLHWYEYLWAAAGAAVSAVGGYMRRGRGRRNEPEPWRPSGPSLPCPPQCRIRVEHRHDPIGAF